MKRKLPILAVALLFFFLQLSNAQITMTATYNPYAGDNYYYSNVNDTSIQPGPSGAAVNWNFSAMSISVSGSVESFVNPSTTPYASSFPGANLALSDLINGYNYFTTSASGIVSNGIVRTIGGTSILHITNVQNTRTYPFTYLSSVTNPNITGTANNGDTLSGTITSVADGYGILNLPGSVSYTNVLRIKTIYDIVSSIGPGTETYYTITEYEWYRSGTKLPVMKIVTYDKDHGNYHSKVVRVGYNLVTGMHETKKSAFAMNTFPNPVSDKVSVEFSLKKNSDIDWMLIDEKGAIVFERKDIDQLSGSHISTFDLGNFSRGVYFLQMNSEGVSEQRKIIIE